MKYSTRQALFSHPLFEHIKPDDDELLKSIRSRLLTKNEILYRPGNEAIHAYLIIEGSIKFDFSLTSGKEAFVEIVNKGFIIGELEILSGFSYQATAVANEDTEIILIPKDTLVNLITNYPEFALKFTRQLATNFYFFQLIASERETSNLKQKLANLLMSLGLRFGSRNRHCITLHISNSALSDMLNSSRQRVNQQLNAWQDENLITCQYGVITIIDVDKLSSFAGLANSFLSEENVLPYQ
jgi:CRP/FNR family transcriptional regulator